MPAPWSAIYSFQTNVQAARGLTAEALSFGLSRVNPETCQIPNSAASFPSTPTFTSFYLAFTYAGSGIVTVHVSRDSVHLGSLSRNLLGPGGCGTVAFAAPGGGPDAGPPLSPGARAFELWHAGQKIRSGGFTITPATGPVFGPMAVGTGVESASDCRLSGASTTFPSTTPRLYFRWNFVGSASYTIRAIRGTTPVAQARGELEGPAGCEVRGYTPSAGFTAGTWRVEVLMGGQVAQSVIFSIT